MLLIPFKQLLLFIHQLSSPDPTMHTFILPPKLQNSQSLPIFPRSDLFFPNMSTLLVTQMSQVPSIYDIRWKTKTQSERNKPRCLTDKAQVNRLTYFGLYPDLRDLLSLSVRPCCLFLNFSPKKMPDISSTKSLATPYRLSLTPLLLPNP